MSEGEKKHILDTSGLLCPLPIVKLSQKAKEGKSGEIIEIISTDRGVLQDIPAWCRSTKNELIEIKEKDGKFFAIVKIL